MDHNAELAANLIYDLQAEHEVNTSVTDGSYIDTVRDTVKDAVMFALDNGWKPND